MDISVFLRKYTGKSRICGSAAEDQVPEDVAAFFKIPEDAVAGSGGGQDAGGAGGGKRPGGGYSLFEGIHQDQSFRSAEIRIFFLNLPEDPSAGGLHEAIP